VTYAEQFLRFIYSSDHIRELRLFNPDGHPWAGAFDDPVRMARNALAAQRHHGATAAYFTLNSIRPEEVVSIGARQLNRMSSRPRLTTRDAHVSRRSIYLIDVDPVRPSGTSSTDEEKAAASDVITRVRKYLTEMGWPEPIFVDSGNGYHLMYKGDGCNASSDAWRFLLKALAARFDTAGAKIDTSVHNASRISRLPGTWNRKGPDTPDRPHRIAQVLSYPAKFESVEHGPRIYRLAADLGYISPFDRPGKRSMNERELLIDEAGVLKLIEEFPNHLELYRVSHDGPITYFALASCPFAGRPHRDHVVGRGKTAIRLRPDSIGFSCFSDDCHDHTFAELLRHLHAETGRRHSMPIWGEPDLKAAIKHWGGVIDVTLSEEEERAFDRLYEAKMKSLEQELMQTPEWTFDNATFTVLYSEDFALSAAAPWPIEPWGLPYSELSDAYDRDTESKAQQLERDGNHDDAAELRYEAWSVSTTDDFEAMANWMGPEQMFLLSRDKQGADLYPEGWRDRPNPTA
jgi:hypothetical protein